MTQNRPDNIGNIQKIVQAVFSEKADLPSHFRLLRMEQ